jgi:hypothetical protein
MDNEPSKNDMLKAENALLRLKLEMEHGMKDSYFASVTPQLENMMLNSIFKFEENLKTAPTITVFEHLGEPEFCDASDLSPLDLSLELERVKDLMEDKGVVLDCLHDYDDAVIYRFITEELFKAEVISMPGSNMIMHFIYEEFHPESSE